MSRPPKELKLYVVRKYIKASSAKEALKLDPTSPVDDIYVDEAWRQASLNKEESSNEIGFKN